MSRQAPDNGAADANDDDDVAVSEDGSEGSSSSGEEEESGDDDDESGDGDDESGDDEPGDDESGESGSEASIAPVCLDQHGRILGVSGCGLDFGFRSFPRALDVERAERFHEVVHGYSQR